MRRAAALAAAVLAALVVSAAAFAAPAAPPTQTPGTLVVGLNLPTLGFQTGAVRDGIVLTPRGFEIELARALAKKLQIGRIVFVHEPVFGRLIDRSPKRWDIALAQITVTSERKKNVDFSIPYLQADQGVLASKRLQTRPRSIAALREIKLCSQRGTTGASAIRTRIKPNVAPRLFAEMLPMFAALEQGSCDAVVFDAPILGAQRDALPDRYGPLLGRIDTRESYGVVLPRDSGLSPFVDEAVDALDVEGTIGRLSRKWLTVDVEKLAVLK